MDADRSRFKSGRSQVRPETASRVSLSAMRSFWEAFKRDLRDSVRGVPVDEARGCQYGDTLGQEGNCDVIVPPYEGYRRGIYVFCSEAHAVLDADDRPW